MKGESPASRTRAMASSRVQYETENSSMSMPSFTEPAWLVERSRMRKKEPDFLETMPIGAA